LFSALLEQRALAAAVIKLQPAKMAMVKLHWLQIAHPGEQAAMGSINRIRGGERPDPVSPAARAPRVNAELKKVAPWFGHSRLAPGTLVQRHACELFPKISMDAF
jgi:hypothetical protein